MVIYKFYCKLIQNNAIKIIFITDTTLISNKLGINNVGYNPQYPKHVS